MTADLAPAEEAAIAAAVADAATAQEPLLIMGNGTKSGMLRPVQAARSLSTRNHIGITLYSPNELVIAARAGTPHGRYRGHVGGTRPAHHRRTA